MAGTIRWLATCRATELGEVSMESGLDGRNNDIGEPNIVVRNGKSQWSPA